MAQKQNYEKWGKKKIGLNANLKYPKSSVPQEKFIKIKNNLEEFSETLYRFFLDGFSEVLGGNKKGIPLLRSAGHPPEYVLRNILTQTSFDLGVIRDAINQRNNPTFSIRLDRLDALAIRAFQRFFPTAEDNNHVRPYVYFNRDTNVRVIPYANAVFIGVPMSALEDNGDLPSISHEVGHHIYENEKIGVDTLDVYFEKYFRGKEAIVQSEERWILNWLEEIFADLYNVITAGPVAALTIQDILEDNLTKDLMKDDGVHPPGYIRPYVTIEVLKLVLDVNDQDPRIKYLSDLWNEAKVDRVLQKKRKFKICKDLTEIEEASARKLIANVVREMYSELKRRYPKLFEFANSNDLVDGFWSQFSQFQNGKFDLDSPYSSFNEFVNTLDVKLILESFETKQKEDFWGQNHKDEWNPKIRFKGKKSVASKDWIDFIQSIKWSKIFADTRPVSGPE